MFTPLNLGFDGSLQPDQRFFPAAGAAPNGSRGTASFAKSLDTSLRAQASSGENLPPDGGSLPPVLDMSLQIAAIEEQVAGTLPAGVLEAGQQPAGQTTLIGGLPSGTASAEANASAPETLASALAFSKSGGLEPADTAATNAVPGDDRARQGSALPVEPTPAGQLATAGTADRSIAVPHTLQRADAGERRLDSTRTLANVAGAPTQSQPALASTDTPEVFPPLTENATEDPRLAELRLSQLAPGAPDPAIRPAGGTGPAVDLPVELPVYRPASAALPEAAAATENTATVSVSSADGAQKALSRAPALPPIATPVGQSDWGESLSERVLVMTSGKLGNAEIRLTPAELGPVRVQVSVDDGTATVSFQASHATTREAIEQALPRLRDMLTENGLSLGQASVSDQGVHDGSREAADDPAAADGLVVEADDETVAESSVPLETRKISSALVDTFA